jgi:putative serine protease PepD
MWDLECRDLLTFHGGRMYHKINHNHLLTMIKESQGLTEDPIKQAIKRALKSNCTITVNESSGDSWSGSGFHVGGGYIATVAHVAQAALIGTDYEMLVTFDGRDQLSAKVIASNHTDDTALIVCREAQDIESVVLGNSDTIETGDIIAVIGSPEGWHDTATVGRITNIEQNLGKSAPSPAWNDMFFIDADILVGSSGGMMIATDGKAYGLTMGVTGYHAEVGVGQNAVIPINKFKKLISTLEFKKTPQ